VSVETALLLSLTVIHTFKILLDTVERVDMIEYDHLEIELKWQRYWKENSTFVVSEVEGVSGRGKSYILDMFPYPSGSGLHIGHPVGYTGSDILSRYRRHQGYVVLHPMGYDSFGLPAEQHVIATGEHPAKVTADNCANFTKQLERLGFSYDWTREIRTSDSHYYKWTQWIFLKLYDSYFDRDKQQARPIAELSVPEGISIKGEIAIREYKDEHRLAYVAEGLVNWCPALGTVLANEEVIDGKSERGGHPVFRQPMRQWFLRITEYADRLIDELDDLEWPESIKDQQRHWIGKKGGCNIDFKLLESDQIITAFTTRADTLFGVTFLVLSPEHPLAEVCIHAEQDSSVRDYLEKVSTLSDLERTLLNREKTGVFTGSYVVNPINNECVPVYIGDYVLMGVGTGAVMGVPAHDGRDFIFARNYGLPIRPVLAPNDHNHPDFEGVCKGEVCWEEAGLMLDLDDDNYRQLGLAGKSSSEALDEIVAWLEKQKQGERVVTYRLRDWLFSRQRYWGEPIPIVHWEDGSMTAVSVDDLPLELPNIVDFKPISYQGTNEKVSVESPLARASEWVNVRCEKTGRQGRRETNTMPQWAGSCWYYLRFIDPHNTEVAWNAELEKAWMPVDFYIGGAEHAVLHLLYARFWHKVLFDLGYASTREPFQRLFNQGMIVSHAFKCERGALIPIDEVVETEPGVYCHAKSGQPVERIMAKMSKSLRNVVNPDELIEQYGADTLRIFLMFMAPLEAVKPWNSDAIMGCFRFLKRVWAWINQFIESESKDDDPQVLKSLHRTIKKVTEDTENLRYNTAISTMMEFLNQASGKHVSRSTVESFSVLLSPYAPHLAEEVWSRLGHKESISRVAWPSYSEDFLQETTVPLVVQVKGKKRAVLDIAVDVEESCLKEAVRKALAGTVYKISDEAQMIIVRDKATGVPKLVNVV
jgi:leucyl-tRNA synthetase